MHGIEVRVLTSIPELSALRSCWNAWSTSMSSDLDRFIDEAETLKTVLSPHVIVFERQGAPVALVAARTFHAIPSWKFGYHNPLWRRRRYLQVVRDGLLGDFSEPSMQEALVEAIGKSLSASRLPFIHFKEMQTAHGAYDALTGLAPAHQRDPIDEKDVHWTTVLPKSLAEFYRLRSKSVRRNAKRYREKLDKLHPGQVSMSCFTKLDDCIDEVRSIANASYQARIGVGFQATPEQVEICNRSANRGSLRVYVLYVEGKAIAYQIGHLVKGTFFAESTSFDPALKAARPGAHLLMRLIEEFCTSPDVSRIDWGYGRATYKEELGTNCDSRANYYYFAPSLRGQALRATRFAIVGSHRRLKQQLDSWKLLDRVRTGWRQLGSKTKQGATKTGTTSNMKQGTGA